MPRLLLSVGGGLVAGISMTLIGGFFASLIMSEMPGGKREGGGAMAGFFVVGPLIGILTLIISSIIIWYLAADPARVGRIYIGLGVLVGITALGTVFALSSPPKAEDPAFKGVKGSVLVEVKFATLPLHPESLVYDFRQGGESLARSARVNGKRTEDGGTILPAEFPLHALQGFIIFGVIDGDKQHDVVSVDLPNTPALTDWSQWKRMDNGSEMRWRVVVETK